MCLMIESMSYRENKLMAYQNYCRAIIAFSVGPGNDITKTAEQ